MYTLRNFHTEEMHTPHYVKKVVLTQVGDAVVSSKLDFQIGYYNKTAKLWLNDEQDVEDALDLLRKNGKLTFWCMGLGRRERAKRSFDEDSDVEDDENVSAHVSKKRKVSSSEEKASRVSELKTQLRQKHGPAYSSVQYALWAEMIVGGTHDNSDEPPPVPMFNAQRHRGRPSSSNLAVALTDVADKIANALSPATTPSRVGTSPGKCVELRGKYIQQLKDLVNLREIGALNSEEYEEQRQVLVNLMRKL